MMKEKTTRPKVTKAALKKMKFQEVKALYNNAIANMSCPAQVLFLKEMTTSIGALMKDQIKAKVKDEVRAELMRAKGNL